jgi:hypothetical protein
MRRVGDGTAGVDQKEAAGDQNEAAAGREETFRLPRASGHQM